ncbi:helix-turn-helix domain-containing protein [Salinactinospora qingdaonensis]|uniref:Cytoskeleton protein RodZ-like C-terminal domain-containing protein n=1 Tax=Salinactinospora qingdaonensis TaxID=702744 RepID=A0ABP7G7V9_9ACTN
MTTIGETIADSRERAGWTVAELSQRTRIREHVIRAIECDDFDQCRGDFYARGHIRCLCATLDIDPLPLIERFDAEHAQAAPPHPLSELPVRSKRDRANRTRSQTTARSNRSARSAPGQSRGAGRSQRANRPEQPQPPEQSQRSDTAESTQQPPPVNRTKRAKPTKSPQHEAKRRRRWPLVVAALAGVVLLGAAMAWPRGGELLRVAAAEAANSLVGLTERDVVDNVDNVAVPAPSPQPEPTPSTTAGPSAPAEDVRLRVSALRRTWISVHDADNAKLFTGVLDQGMTHDYTAAERLRVHLADAGSVRMTVNGTDVGSPGAEGEVLQLTLDAAAPQGELAKAAEAAPERAAAPRGATPAATTAPIVAASPQPPHASERPQQLREASAPVDGDTSGATVP